MTAYFQASLLHPEEVRKLPKTEVSVVHLDQLEVLMAVFQPGWRWDDHVKPVVGTQDCEAGHLLYAVSGKMIVQLPDGKQHLVVPGDVVLVDPHHTAWVPAGETEPFVGIDFGNSRYGVAK